MLNRIKNLIKNNFYIYNAYNILGSLIMKSFAKILNINNKKILFVAYGGKKFDDSPKAIYESMKNDSYFKEYKLIWAFINPDKINCVIENKIKIDSLRYYYDAITSKVWITNSAIERGMQFKKKNTLYVNTWHGTPIKKINGEEVSKRFKKYYFKKSNIDILCAQSEYDKNIFSRVFNCNMNNIFTIDLPRNDNLTKYSDNEKRNIKKILGIKTEKVILYAPTYREYWLNNKNNLIMKSGIDYKDWINKIGNEYTILKRDHYEIEKHKTDKYDFIIDVSDYPYINDLMAISDILISDYSSILFDYSILGKPIIIYAYDIEEYKKMRGLYVDIEKYFDLLFAKDQDSLINIIKNLNYEKECKRAQYFKQKYAPYSGNATERVIKLIKNRINRQ